MAYYKCGSVYTTQNSNVVVDTASGPIANFETPLAMPLLDAQIDVNAVQDLHGQSGAYPAGGGVNKFDKDTMVVSGYYIADTDGQAKPDSGSSCTDYIEINPDTSYYIKTEQTVGQWAAWYDENKDYISGFTMYNRVVTSPSTAKYIRLTISRGESGNINTFSVNYPSTDTAYHPYSNICPIEGWSEISLVKTGYNLFDISTKTDGKALKWSDGDTFNDALSIVSDFIVVKEGYKIISNYIAQWCCYDKNKNYLGNILSNALIKTSGADRADNTIPSGYGICYLRLGYRSALNNNEDMTEKTDIMLNIGNTVMPFEPYAGNEYIINLGNTYYGGHFTQDKAGHRQFEVTHGYRPFSMGMADGLWSQATWGGGGTVYSRTIPCKSNELTTLTGAMSEIYKEVTPSSMYNRTEPAFCINDTLIRVRDNRFSTFDEWKEAVKDYYYTFVLETPTIIDLPDGTPFKSLPGVNNIFADTGDTAVKFRKIGE